MSQVERRPGEERVPKPRVQTHLPPFAIICDTREQTPPPFPEGTTLQRATLGEGDYTTPRLKGVAVIERKSVSDFASTITHGRDRFEREIERLRPYRWKCIAVEGELNEVYRVSLVHPHSVIGSIASFYARADLPTFLLSNPHGVGRFIAGTL
ncbi:MAG: ERCC4 domain-containing protein, partial [Patescibacteria group bacterium]|nr:ERCC4 domain-containing protein [Patescibacteria group bacterium]